MELLGAWWQLVHTWQADPAAPRPCSKPSVAPQCTQGKASLSVVAGKALAGLLPRSSALAPTTHHTGWPSCCSRPCQAHCGPMAIGTLAQIPTWLSCHLLSPNSLARCLFHSTEPLATRT